MYVLICVKRNTGRRKQTLTETGDLQGGWKGSGRARVKGMSGQSPLVHLTSRATLMLHTLETTITSKPKHKISQNGRESLKWNKKEPNYISNSKTTALRQGERSILNTEL